MPQNTMGSYTGHQAQPIFKTGAPQRPGQTPLTPQAGLGTGLPPPAPVTQNIPGPSFGGSNIFGGPAISQDALNTASAPTPTTQSQTPYVPGSGRDQLVAAILNESGTPPAPGTPPGLYGSAENSSVFNPVTGRRYEPYVRVSHIWAGGNQPGWLFDPGRKYGGIKNPGRFRPTPYQPPGKQGRLSTPFATMPDQYPEFRRDVGGVMGGR